MRYSGIRTGVFLARPNRFVAMVDVDGSAEVCHVKNTGRCREILVPGAKVVLQEFPPGARKTRFDLVAVYKGDLLINIDSQAPNPVFIEALPRLGLLGPDPTIRPETTHGDSRFDVYAECGGRRAFIEVKGVTLEDGGAVMFPDAPTERGLKHVRGLIRCVEEGYEAYLVFVVQMGGARGFSPNYATHMEFGLAVEEAVRAGVRVLAYGCEVTESSIELGDPVPLAFDRQRTRDRMVS